MSCYQDLPRYDIPAKATYPWLASITDSTGARIAPADVTAIRVDVVELAGTLKRPVNQSGAYITDGSAYATPVISTTIKANWVTDDPEWKVNSQGYNLRYVTQMPLPDKTYLAKITVNLANTEVVVVAAIFSTY